MTLQHAHSRTTTSLTHTVRPARSRRTAVSSGHTTPTATALPGSIALLSTYPPTQCGLATFTQALYGQLSKLPGRVGIISVLDAPDDGTHASPGVVGYLVNGSTASAAETARTLNGYGTVIVQHEYGIYGGRDGVDVLEVVEALTVPTIVVLAHGAAEAVRQPARHPEPARRRVGCRRDDDADRTPAPRGVLRRRPGADRGDPARRDRPRHARPHASERRQSDAGSAVRAHLGTARPGQGHRVGDRRHGVAEGLATRGTS